jgi:hypothetical protein
MQASGFCRHPNLLFRVYKNPQIRSVFTIGLQHITQWRLPFVTVPHKTRLRGLTLSIHLQPHLERLPNVLNANVREPVIHA